MDYFVTAIERLVRNDVVSYGLTDSLRAGADRFGFSVLGKDSAIFKSERCSVPFPSATCSAAIATRDVPAFQRTLVEWRTSMVAARLP